MTHRLAAALALLAAGDLAAQRRPDPRVEAAARTIVAADLMRDATYLASDALRGRATPSPGLDSAAAYVVRALARMGATPAGDGGTYLQHYTVAHSVLDTAATHAAVGGRRLAWGDDFVVRSFLAPGVREGGVVYVGGGLRAPKLDIDPYARVDVRGRWLLAHADAIPAGLAPRDLGRHGVDFTTVADEARSRGALGVLIVPSAAARATWGMSRGRVPTSRELEPSVGRAFAPSPVPQLVLSRQGLEALLAGSAVRAADLLAADPAGRPRAPAPTGATLRVTLAATTTRVRPYNVVALVPGADARLRDEWVSVSSHLDGAVGRAPDASGDSVYNAADDNASGSAGALAVARALLGGPRPKRSVLLVWDSGEETGLWGSRALAYGPLAEKLVAHFTVDMIARTKRPGTSAPGEEELSGPGEVYAAARARSARAWTPRSTAYRATTAG
jgi:hypothetical protein